MKKRQCIGTKKSRNPSSIPESSAFSFEGCLRERWLGLKGEESLQLRVTALLSTAEARNKIYGRSLSRRRRLCGPQALIELFMISLTGQKEDASPFITVCYTGAQTEDQALGFANRTIAVLAQLAELGMLGFQYLAQNKSMLLLAGHDWNGKTCTSDVHNWPQTCGILISIEDTSDDIQLPTAKRMATMGGVIRHQRMWYGITRAHAFPVRKLCQHRFESPYENDDLSENEGDSSDVSEDISFDPPCFTQMYDRGPIQAGLLMGSADPHVQWHGLL